MTASVSPPPSAGTPTLDLLEPARRGVIARWMDSHKKRPVITCACRATPAELRDQAVALIAGLSGVTSIEVAGDGSLDVTITIVANS